MGWVQRQPYKWEEVQKYFPPERIAGIRAEIIELWKSEQYPDREIWMAYGMSETSFYELINRYKEEKEEGLHDKSSRPKEPARKIGHEEEKIIETMATDDRKRIEEKQNEFEERMNESGKVLSAKKLSGLKSQMFRALLGVRRIAFLFNQKMRGHGEPVTIGKSTVHKVLTKLGFYKKEEKVKSKFTVHRPAEPLSGLGMDFTEKVIGNGSAEPIFGVIDRHNNMILVLDATEKENSENVRKRLDKLRRIIPVDKTVHLRSDSGRVFVEETLHENCENRKMHIHNLPKGCSWLNAHIERSFRTIKEEYLNLRWIGNREELQDALDDAKYLYNRRPTSGLGYRTPLQAMMGD